jgi:hypothetical protein
LLRYELKLIESNLHNISENIEKTGQNTKERRDLKKEFDSYKSLQYKLQRQFVYSKFRKRDAFLKLKDICIKPSESFNFLSLQQQKFLTYLKKKRSTESLVDFYDFPQIINPSYDKPGLFSY